MLVIRCRAGESVLIGDDIEVEIADIGTNRVKLGISAPRQVPVIRKALKLTRQENVAAAATVPLERLGEIAAGLRRP